MRYPILLWVEPIQMFLCVVLEGAILISMMKRKLWKDFPFFFVYVAWDLISNVPLNWYLILSTAADKTGSPPYWYLWFGTGLVGGWLGIAAIYEAMRELLEPRNLRIVGRVFAFLLGALFIFMLAPIFMASPWVAHRAQMPYSDLLIAVVKAYYGSHLIRLGAGVAFILAALFFRLRWTSYTAMLVFGFVLYDAWDCIYWVDNVSFERSGAFVKDLDPLLFLVACILWLWGSWHSAAPYATAANSAALRFADARLRELDGAMAALEESPIAAGPSGRLRDERA